MLCGIPDDVLAGLAVLVSVNCVLSTAIVPQPELTFSLPQGTELVVGISKIIRHEDYRSTPSNDIMLLKLETPVSYNQYMKPICLPTQDKNEQVQDWCYVTGWGLLGHNGRFARILQEAKVQVSKTLFPFW